MLLGDIDLDASPAITALGRVDSKFTTTTGGMLKMGAVGGAALAGIEVAMKAIESAAEMFKEAVDLGGVLNDLSTRTGETVGGLVILREAFQEAGLGADGVEPFLLKLQNSLGGVNEEGGKTEDAFAALKISADSLRDLDAIGQIDALQKGFEGIADQATKVQVARNLFGKSGGQMLSLLGDPQVMDDARRRAGPLAEIMEKNAGSFDKLGDVIGSLKLSFMEFSEGALSKIAPEATTIAEALGDIDFVGIGEGIGTLASIVLKLGEAFVFIAPFINSASEGLSHFLGSDSKASSGFGAKYRGLNKAASGEDSSQREDKSPVSALQKAGGGGGFGTGGDAHLGEARRHTKILETIAANTSHGKSGGDSKPPEV